MTKFIEIAGVILAIAVVLGLIVTWQMFNWKECKKVGHSTFYCVMNAGK